MANSELIQKFFAAIARGDHEAVVIMLNDTPDLVYGRGKHSYWSEGEGTPLQLAAEHGDARIVRELLDRGADVNDKAAFTGWVPLHLALKNPKVARLLVSRGAHVDIHAAAGLGDLRRVKRFISENPDSVHARGPDGATPLHFAATPKVAAFLLDHGADINARDDDHRMTPLAWSAKNRPVVRLLLKRGASVDNAFVAAAVGDLARLRAFIDADPSLIRAATPAGDYYGPGATLLHIAAGNGHDAVSRFCSTEAPTPTPKAGGSG